MVHKNTRKTTEEFKNEIYAKYKDEYTVIGDYITKDTKIEMIHNKCGNIVNVTPHNALINKSACKYCAAENRKRTNHLRFLNSERNTYLERLKNVNPKLFDKIIIKNPNDVKDSVDKSLIVESKETGIVYKNLSFRQLYVNSDIDKNIKLTTKILMDKVNLKSDNGWDAITEYTAYSEKITCKCRVCGKVRTDTPSNFKYYSNCGCVAKARNLELRINNYKNKFSERPDSNEYIIDWTNYKNNRTKLKIHHKNCGKDFISCAHEFIDSSNSCPICSKSLSEKYLVGALKKYNFTFKEQYTFSKCKDKLSLRFDVFIPNLNLVIEFDGEYHYYPIRGVESFEKTKMHDEIKNRFCSENNINIIRIPFYLRDKIYDVIKYLNDTNSVNDTCMYINSLKTQRLSDFGGEIPPRGVGL